MRIQNFNSNSNNQYKPSFNAEIYCLDNKAFKKVLDKIMPYANEVGSLKTRRYVLDEASLNSPANFTFHACECMLVSIFNTEKKLNNMYHLKPSESNINSIKGIKNAIFEQARTFKGNSNKPLEGFVSGGDCSDFNHGYNFSDFRDEILDVMDKISKKVGMNYSVISGRRFGDINENLISDATKNTHYLNVEGLGDNPNNIKDLKVFFDKKKISPTDSIIISGIDVTDFFIDKTSQEISTSKLQSALSFFKKFTAN